MEADRQRDEREIWAGRITGEFEGWEQWGLLILYTMNSELLSLSLFQFL